MCYGKIEVLKEKTSKRRARRVLEEGGGGEQLWLEGKILVSEIILIVGLRRWSQKDVKLEEYGE